MQLQWVQKWQVLVLRHWHSQASDKKKDYRSTWILRRDFSEEKLGHTKRGQDEEESNSKRKWPPGPTELISDLVGAPEARSGAWHTGVIIFYLT